MSKSVKIINESSLDHYRKTHPEEFLGDQNFSTCDNQYTDDPGYDEERIQGNTLLYRYDNGRYDNALGVFDSERIYVSKEYYKKKEEELIYLQNQKRNEVVQKLSEARWYGSGDENYELKEALKEQYQLEMKIKKLYDEYSRFEVFPFSRIDRSCVSLFTHVTVRNISTDKNMEFSIVTEREADYANNKISITAPLAKGLLYRHIGDIVNVEVPRGTLLLEIVNIIAMYNDEY